MALVGSREGECAGGKVVDFTDGRFSARQIEMVPCGQFFSLSVRAVGPRAWVTWTSLGWTSERNQKRLTPIVGWN